MIISEQSPASMSGALSPDIEMARRFLSRLDSSGTYTFQTFSDRKELRTTRINPKGKKSVVDPNARVFHGAFDELSDQLINQNLRQVGIFVMVNEGDGVIHAGEKTCRREGNIVRLRAHVLDLDGSPLEPVLAAQAEPHIVVESSPGRWHTYWLLEPNEVSDANRVSVKAKYKAEQLAIAEKFGGDLSVCDLPRVLRVPGFLHQKAEPFLTRLVDREALP